MVFVILFIEFVYMGYFKIKIRSKFYFILEFVEDKIFDIWSNNCLFVNID